MNTFLGWLFASFKSPDLGWLKKLIDHKTTSTDHSSHGGQRNSKLLIWTANHSANRRLSSTSSPSPVMSCKRRKHLPTAGPKVEGDSRQSSHISEAKCTGRIAAVGRLKSIPNRVCNPLDTSLRIQHNCVPPLRCSPIANFLRERLPDSLS
jgi:hypothetical protein